MYLDIAYFSVYCISIGTRRGIYCVHIRTRQGIYSQIYLPGWTGSSLVPAGFLTAQSARNTLQVIKQPYTPSSIVCLLLFLEAAFVCLLIHCEESVKFVQFLPECCLTIEYIQYKIVSFPLENVQFVQFADVSLVPECCL